MRVHNYQQNWCVALHVQNYQRRRSSVSVVTWPWTRLPRNRRCSRRWLETSANRSGRYFAPRTLLFRGYRHGGGGCSAVVSRPWHEAGHLPNLVPRLRISGSCTSISSYVFMGCTRLTLQLSVKLVFSFFLPSFLFSFLEINSCTSSYVRRALTSSARKED